MICPLPLCYALGAKLKSCKVSIICGRFWCMENPIGTPAATPVAKKTYLKNLYLACLIIGLTMYAVRNKKKLGKLLKVYNRSRVTYKKKRRLVKSPRKKPNEKPKD